MAENRKEELTAKLVGVQTGAARTIYLFENHKDLEHPRKVSAFPPKELGDPELPFLNIGATYALTIIHKPAGEGKFYHNLAHGKDGYLIKLVSPEPKPNTEKLNAALGLAAAISKALEPDGVYSIVEQSAVDALEIMQEKIIDKRPGLTKDDIGGVFSTIFGTLAIERFRRSRQ